MVVEYREIKKFFCTYFDENYLPRALALVSSLEKHCPDFHLFALCMDESCYQELIALQHRSITAISLTDLEAADPDLFNVKQNRSRVEYYWTCGPAFILHLFNKYAEVQFLSYIDSDIFFFSTPKSLFDEMEGYSIGIIEHRFPPNHADRNRFGIYNVGWLGFRRDDNGLECLRWWRERCIEWCYDYIDQGRFGDQKYLDDWPVRFKRVRVINNKGANVAPWNLDSYGVRERNGQVLVDDDPLIFFHFHGFKQLSGSVYDTNLGRFGCRPSKSIRRQIFGSYIKQLRYLTNHGPLRTLRSTDSMIVVRALRLLFRTALGITFRSYIVVLRDRVL
ncbi:MAG: glycosyl transferase family 2 [Acidobacteriaceae bacterium]|nr:glycosyl transferase family 2 [Acidobacteriaceae bacterium]